MERLVSRGGKHMFHWLVSVAFLAAAAEKPDEPHPFPPEQYERYHALFERFERDESGLEGPAGELAAANRGNPRAHRFLGMVLGRAGQNARAAEELERALSLGIAPPQRRADVLANLARLEIQTDPTEARRRLEEAQSLDPDGANVVHVLVLLEDKQHHAPAARANAERLALLAPDSGHAHALLAAMRWNDGDHLGAYEAVQRARALGVSEPYFQEIESGARPERWVHLGLWILLGCVVVLGAWLGLVALLGRALSRAELSALADVKADLGSGARTSREARVERVYSWVLWSAVALLVVALPALIAGTAGLGLGLVWAMFQVGYISIKLLLIVVAGTAVALWGMVRALFVRLNAGAGRSLTPEEEPRLHALAADVARAVKARPVGEILLHSGAGIGVNERGSTLRVLLGRGTGVLHLGYAALQNLTVGELRAVLAHEYGHLSHGETQLTPVLARVEISSIAMLQGTAQAGLLALINPAYWFLRGYVQVYLRITRGQGRRRELLADRVAALTYGGDTFARALTRAGEASGDVNRAVNVLGILRTVGIRADSLYALQAMRRTEMLQPLRRALEEESRHGEKSEFDTHPPNAERIERVR
ncbi:MAG TPA: M48 family metalloprotease, partial [Myxococcaceae bacterium]|nr:M48 family metalloprotease [Myxococcaceae bacterium]